MRKHVIVLGLLGAIAAGCATGPSQEQLANLDYGAQLSVDAEPLIRDWFQKHAMRPSGIVLWTGAPRKYWVKAEPLLGGQITAGYAVPVICQGKSLIGITGYSDWVFLFRDDKIVAVSEPQVLAARRVWLTDNLTYSMPGKDAWDMQHSSYSEDKVGATGRSSILEFPGKDQTVEHWQELHTIQQFNRKYYPDTPEVFINKLKAKMQARCPNVDWKVLQQESGSILYEWSITNYPGNDDQHEVARILSGPYTTWRLAVTAKGKDLPAEKRDDWIKSLSEAKLSAKFGK